MKLTKKSNIKWNIFYIIIYIIFLFIFPFFKNYLSGNEISVNKGVAVLNVADKSTDIALNSFEGIMDYFYSRKYLLAEINKLQEDLLQEKDKNIIKENLIQNNKEIIIAKKIFTDFTSVYDTILINKGAQDGIDEGDFVFIDENKIIGKISKVNKNSSLITLFSKNKEKVEGIVNAVKNQNTVLYTKEDTGVGKGEDIDNLNTENKIENSTNTVLLDKDNENINPKIVKNGTNILIDLFGYGGGDFIANVPGNIEVAIGDIVYFGIDESKYLGEIVSIDRQDASFYQVLLIRGYYNTRQNDNYYILKN